MSSDQTPEEKTNTSTSEDASSQTPDQQQTTSLPSKVLNDPFGNWDVFEKSKIEITLGNPVLRNELFSKYYVYKIQGNDLKGYFETSRRYSDFEKIRNLLVSKWPGCFVPSLPPKILNNMDEEMMKERARFLGIFCKRIAEIPYFHYSDVYQTLLRCPMVDLDPILQKYQKVHNEDIIRRYSIIFNHISETEFKKETVSKITNFFTFLTKTQVLFEKFVKTTKALAEANKEYSLQLVSFHQMMTTGLEKEHLNEYHGHQEDKNVFTKDPSSKTNVAIKGMVADLLRPTTFEDFCEWIQIEARDIEAFKESFLQREKYEKMKSRQEEKQKSDTNSFHNLASGKKSFSSLFTRPPSENDLTLMESKINIGLKDMENLMRVQDMISVILANEEIEKFKKSKHEKYYQAIKLLAFNENIYLNKKVEYWTGVLECPNLKDLTVPTTPGLKKKKSE